MVLLTEVTGTIFSGFMTYLLKMLMYLIVAAIGIFIGIKMRKKKDLKESDSITDDK